MIAFDIQPGKNARHLLFFFPNSSRQTELTMSHLLRFVWHFGSHSPGACSRRGTYTGPFLEGVGVPRRRWRQTGLLAGDGAAPALDVLLTAGSQWQAEGRISLRSMWK